MAGNDTIFKFSNPKSRPVEVLRDTPAKADAACDDHIILDMGEASRLEGFRQNGCR